MALIHIIDPKIIVHTKCPGGQNQAKKHWKDVLLHAGLSGRTCLVVGDGINGTTQAEYDALVAGELIESVIPVKNLEANINEPQKFRKLVRHQATENMRIAKIPLEWSGLTLGEN